MRNWNQQLIIYALSFLALIIVETRFQTTINAALISANEPNILLHTQIHNSLENNWHSVGLDLQKLTTPQSSSLALAPPAAQAAQPESKAVKQPAPPGPSGASTVSMTSKQIISSPAVSIYRVTAYYLNIRSAPEAASKIVSVSEKGVELTVENVLPNGWLALHGGGYVNGKYAELVKSEPVSGQLLELQPPSTETEPEASRLLAAAAERQSWEPDADPAKPTSKVGEASNLTEDDIAELFDGTELEGHDIEEAVLEVEEEYGINALFTVAVMKLESGNGKSKLAKNKNNLFGLNATGGGNHKAFSFETKGDSVRKFGQLLAKNYVGKGYTTIDKIAKKYCPANPKWASLVLNIMKRDYNKL